MQKGSFAGIVQAQEEELGVLVEEAKGGQDIVDCRQAKLISNRTRGSQASRCNRVPDKTSRELYDTQSRCSFRGLEGPGAQGKTRNKGLLTPVNDPHGGNGPDQRNKGIKISLTITGDNR